MLVAVVNLDIMVSVPRPVAAEKRLWDKYLDIIDSHDLEFSNEYSISNLIVLRQASQKIQGMAKGSISSSMGRAYTIATNLGFTLRQEKLPFTLDLVMSNDNNNGLHIDKPSIKVGDESFFPIYRTVGYYAHKSSNNDSVYYAYSTLDTYQLLGPVTSGASLEYFKEIQENYFYHTQRELDQRQFMDIFNAQNLLNN